MSIKKRVERVPATTHEVTERFCDFCGAEVPEEFPGTGEYEFASLRVETGSNYRGDGSATADVYDVCPKCFRSKVMPALASIGLKPRTEERDW
jgi:hypothetical protein